MSTQIRLPEQNHVLVVGRLTRDPEVRYTQKGQAIASFDIAINRRYKDATSNEWKDDTVFMPVVVWGAAAERCKERLKKGSPVHVEGRLTMDEWTDKNGQKRKNILITSKRLQFLAMSERSTQSFDEQPQNQTEQKADTKQTEKIDTATELDDVPF